MSAERSISAPIQLESYEFSEFHFEEDDKQDSSSGLGIGYNVHAHASDPQRFRVTLYIAYGALKTDDETEQKMVRLEIRGIFVCNKGIEENEKLGHLNISAPSMLYGIARGFIAQFTAATPCAAPVMLPSIMFDEVVRDMADEAIKNREKAAGANKVSKADKAKERKDRSK